MGGIGSARTVIAHGHRERGGGITAGDGGWGGWRGRATEDGEAKWGREVATGAAGGFSDSGPHPTITVAESAYLTLRGTG